jgi:hypothetical protein
MNETDPGRVADDAQSTAPPEQRGRVTVADILAAQARLERALRAPADIRRQRDQLIRTALEQGDTTKPRLAEVLPLSEQHLGRIEKGYRPDRSPVTAPDQLDGQLTLDDLII